jgi:histidinol dehydrogenase
MLKITDVKQFRDEELKQLMTKPSFDQVVLGEKAQASIRRNFGRDLTALQVVDQIVSAVRRDGDDALFHYTQLIDGVTITKETFEVSSDELDEALDKADKTVLASIDKAVQNVRAFHAEQLPKSWITYREQGSILGQNVRPLDCVGIYVPGGTASYPSSVIMNAVPAAVAGVKEIIMTVPPTKDGKVNPYVLAAAKASGVSRIFKIGGAQAIAGLAFGTKLLPRVDKITGPGNIFVTLAKKAVYGYCDIDMLAGPSEILIIADQTAKPAYVAADLLSQAEHDPLASSILITDSRKLAEDVCKEVTMQLSKLSRQEIAQAALQKNGKIILVDQLKDAIKIANFAAPEHLEILTAQPFELLPFIRHAGAIFLGPYSPEPLGDYLAGPNHILPTGGTARFYSVLNVDSFMKKTSLIAYTKQGLRSVSSDVICLATAEGLGAHANAVRLREE